MFGKIKKFSNNVYKELGSGYSEDVYEKAMEIEFRLAGIPYENQRVLPIFYKNFAVGTSRPDLIINDKKGNEKIIIELKATSSKLSKKEEVQLRKYLKKLKMKKGILINFPQLTEKETPKGPEFKIVE